MSWNWKFYKLLDKSEKRWFWGTSLFNVALLLIFFAVGYFVSPISQNSFYLLLPAISRVRDHAGGLLLSGIFRVRCPYVTI